MVVGVIVGVWFGENEYIVDNVRLFFFLFDEED